MRAILGLTAAYVLILAVMMFNLSSVGSGISNIIFGEALFALPMMAACVVAAFLKRAEGRRVMFVFQIAYSILSVAVFYSTFAVEHDAQYQLALFFIPLIGFPTVAIAGAIAATARGMPR